MRDELQKIGSKGKHTFKATVALFGHRMLCGISRKTVLLRDITQDGELVTDHVWVEKDQGFYGIKSGDIIEFSAKVIKYNKGYKGDVRKVEYASPICTDYKISNPTQIKKVGHSKKDYKGGGYNDNGTTRNDKRPYHTKTR